MTAGNNIPFNPDGPRSKKAPVQAFSRKHSGAPGNPNSPSPAPRDMRGSASSGRKANDKAAIQKAAGKRLFGGTPGSFVQTSHRNT